MLPLSTGLLVSASLSYGLVHRKIVLDILANVC